MSCRRTRLARRAAIALAALGLGAGLWRCSRRPPGILEVPLGVEQAILYTTDGRLLEPLPFAWGVAVNLRVAEVRESGTARVHDVRYIVNRPGDFDLKAYLRFADGSPADALPSFRVRGSERLSKDLATRIAETEDTRVRLHARYYRTLALLAVGWIAWLLLLIFWGRGRARPAAPPPPEPSLADRVRALLPSFENGTLDARELARLELLLFRLWRQPAGTRAADLSAVSGEAAPIPPPALTMAEALAAFRADPAVAEAYAELERWLHRPARPASPDRAARALRANLERGADPGPGDTGTPNPEAAAS